MAKALKKISAVFLIKDGDKYLFQKRKKYSLYQGGYVLPGGHIEEGESVLKGAVRELYEELDINVQESDLEFKMVEPVGDYVVFFFEVKKYAGEIKNKEPEKHLDMCFLPLTDKKIHPLTLNEVLKIEQGVHFFQEDNCEQKFKMMRLSSRAVLISKDKKAILIKRTKPETGTYYVTPGGGIEQGETPLQALERELKEEVGSEIINPRFLFHYDDYDKMNSVDFFLCYEKKRGHATGSEWTKDNSKINKYEIVEVTLDEIENLNLKPDELKEKLIFAFKDGID